jgi:hypothetical protein
VDGEERKSLLVKGEGEERRVERTNLPTGKT